MLTIHSFLRNLFQFVKSLVITVSKRTYRTASVITVGAVVLAVVSFHASGYTGGGKNAIPPFEDADGEQELAEIEEIDDTKAEIQVGQTDESLQQVQYLLGDQLVKSVQSEMQEETAAVEELEVAVVTQEKQPVISYTEEDYQVMLKIVEAEAGDCGLRGKVLVANVIINRVQSERFPNTITEVVYQRNKHTAQFSPVSNGSINRVTVTQETIESVELALFGEDYSEGALFFMMRSASAKKNISWFDRELKYLFKDGPHEFFTYY